MCYIGRMKTLTARIRNQSGTLTLCIRNGSGDCLVQAELELVNTGDSSTGSIWTAEMLSFAGMPGINVAGKVLQVKPEKVIGSCGVASAFRKGFRFVQKNVQALHAGRVDGSTRVQFRTEDGKLVHPSIGTRSVPVVRYKALQ